VKYTACFMGCVVGSRTPFSEQSWLNVDIEANSEDEARSKLYQTHENIKRLFWLWPGKQTVCKQPPHSLALKKGHTHYVSTYTDKGWMQMNCKAHEIEAVKKKQLDTLELRNKS